MNGGPVTGIEVYLMSKHIFNTQAKCVKHSTNFRSGFQRNKPGVFAAETETSKFFQSDTTHIHEWCDSY